MLNALANLAIRRSRAVVVTAILASIVAAALGAGVASRLDPYGADDPATESVQADNRLDDAGFQDLGLIALVRGVDVSSPQTKQRVESLASRISEDPAVGRISRLLHHGLAALRLHGRQRHLSRGRPEAHRRQGAARTRRSGSPTDWTALPGVTLGGPGARPGAGEQAGRVRPAPRRAARLPAPVPALAALLPQRRRRPAAAADRRPGDRRHVPDAEGGERARPRSRSSPSTWSPGWGSAWRSTTACSWSPATGRRSPAAARAPRRCGGRWRPPGGRSSSRR